MPILSATILTSGSCEISCCNGLASSTVFCRLVPMGALTLTLNSPESYVGWNSVPTKGSNSKFNSSEIMPTATTFFGLSNAQTIKLSYISRTDWKPASNLSRALCTKCVRSLLLCSSVSALIQYAETIGVSEKATIVENATAKATVRPNCLKNWPMVSPILPIGTNTAIKLRDVAKIASVSSSVASLAATNGVCPISIWRKIFSITTIASSIKMPTARLKAISDILFSVKPITFIIKKVAIIDVGIHRPPIIVARKLRRNRYVIKSARKPPKRIAFQTSAILSRI